MSLFEPASIAVIGASGQPGKVGHDILKNLLTQGYAGKVFPVNPKYPDLLGAAAYPSVSAIPETPELAIIVTPAPTVTALAEECGAKGVKTLMVITAGFKEMGTEDGRKREEELAAVVRRQGMTLIGANCLGMLRPGIGLNASFAKELPPAGGTALLSQSGALAVALMDQAAAIRLGFSVVVSMGNKTVHDECEFLEACEADPATTVIGMYLESINDGHRFRAVAARVAARKPIVLLKSGTSAHGRKAVSSHTGALAGSDAAIDAVCLQAGIRRAHTAEEFTDLLRALSTQPSLPSPRVAVITNAGGPGILATDAAEREKLTLVALADRTTAVLKAALPEAASAKNPVDVLGDAGADRYGAALEACREDPSVDGIVVLLTPQVMTPSADIARIVAQAKKTSPLLPIIAGFMGGETVEEARGILEDAGIPTYDTPERAMHALAALRPVKPSAPPEAAPRSPTAERAARLLADKEGLLSEDVVTELLALYELPSPRGEVAASADEAVAIAERIGLPVIAKISSPDILHKTDVGGIRADLKTADDVRAAYDAIRAGVAEKMPQADVRGVLIQQFLPVGSEFIVGSVRDPAFGPLVMVGLGGIYTELFRDTAFRVAPIDEQEAYAMLAGLKAWKLLLGMRGKGQSDIAALAGLLTAIARLVTDCPSIVELDLNPVLVRENGVVVADAKIVVKR